MLVRSHDFGRVAHGVAVIYFFCMPDMDRMRHPNASGSRVRFDPDASPDGRVFHGVDAVVEVVEIAEGSGAAARFFDDDIGGVKPVLGLLGARQQAKASMMCL
jgi:hypothetical protein